MRSWLGKKRIYHDPNLGLATKARAWKGADQECNSRVTLTLPGVRKNVRE